MPNPNQAYPRDRRWLRRGVIFGSAVALTAAAITADIIYDYPGDNLYSPDSINDGPAPEPEAAHEDAGPIFTFRILEQGEDAPELQFVTTGPDATDADRHITDGYPSGAIVPIRCIVMDGRPVPAVDPTPEPIVYPDDPVTIYYKLDVTGEPQFASHTQGTPDRITAQIPTCPPDQR